MNKAQFEVWKKRQEQVYQNRLEALRNDMAKRGLTSSGIRDKAEADLKDEFESDIEIARIYVEEEEAKKKSWVPDGNWRPFIASAIVSILIAVSVFFLTDYIKSHKPSMVEKQNDPLDLRGPTNQQLDDCLKSVNPNDPLGITSETETQKLQREACITKYNK